jgi:glutamate/tyrosine decarboxylase-like PLP-dependent enzyme
MRDGAKMHTIGKEALELRESIIRYAVERMDLDPAPLDAPQTKAWLDENVPKTITEDGLGGQAALSIFGQLLAPATISTDHPNFLSFIPNAPSEAATFFDLVVSASSIYGGSWMEGSGAVYAENQVLEFLAKEVGLPEGAGGLFVQGGTLGNLSALVTAREVAKDKGIVLAVGRRWAAVCSSEAHSSLKAVAKVMDIELIKAPVDQFGKLTGEAVAKALRDTEHQVFCVVATAGTTNFGIVDRIEEIAKVTTEKDIWLHVDGAYGLAGILDPETKHLFKGLEHCDSFIVDPHKWLYAPFDACALVYREPKKARDAHMQKGEYLEALNDSPDHNPADYGFGLTRRVRGLPLWFSMATHGIAAYRDAIALNNQLAKQIAKEISARSYLTLIREPELSVVVFERNGWSQPDYDTWSEKLLLSGFAFVLPSSHKGRPNLRFAIINPKTSFEDLVAILDSLED